jgi:hypothetical protein
MFGLWFGDSHMGFGTHLPILASVVLQARPGPVVEYGMGLYSTPLLHMLCEEMGRRLISFDGDPPWAEKFSDLRTDSHKIYGVKNWPEHEPIVDAIGPLDVVFIDHGPEDRRVVDADRLAYRSEFVIVHDWAVGVAASDWQRRLSQAFRFVATSRLGPNTAVLSNIRTPSMPAWHADV